jgi:Zn-dependent peptidase ImmA (M78 family)/DNA-binding XRE family transcriptional regulator
MIMTLTQEILGERLRDARKSVQLSQEQAASAVGLDRTALTKIESGQRPVNSLELTKLASLYRRDLSELLSNSPLEDDPFVLIGRANTGHCLEADGDVTNSIELLKKAVQLEELLGDRIRELPPSYPMAAPQSFEEAIEQGRELALRERRRLGLGTAPIQDLAELIAAQGVWTSAVSFPDDVSGLFISHRRYGLAVFVNQDHRRARRRFSYAHEFAHVLADRDQAPEPTSKSNAKTFREKRANAFASEFLIPEDGVHETLARMRKGGATRGTSYLWDPVEDEVSEVAVRADPLTIRIGVHDVAFLAHEYKVSYEMAAIRLKDIDVIRKPHLEELLSVKDAGRSLMSTLKLFNPDAEEPSQPYLKWQVVNLALEAYRRERISRGRFIEAVAATGMEPKDVEQLFWIASQGKDD